MQHNKPCMIFIITFSFFALLLFSGCSNTAIIGKLLPRNPSPPVIIGNHYQLSDVPRSTSGVLTISLAQNDLLAVYNRSSFFNDNCRFDFSLQAANSQQSIAMKSATPSAEARFRNMIHEQNRENGQLLGTPDSLMKRAAAPGVGSSRSFWIYDFDAGTNVHVSIRATLLLVGQRCNIYFDDASTVRLSAAQLQQTATAWDDSIYPNITSVFGQPSDVDGNGKVNLLFSPRLGKGSGGSYIGGYFDSTDLYSSAQRQYSNECEILYINTLLITQNQANIRAAFDVMPHELQHLINYQHRFSNDWISIDEGMSGLAESLAGYGLKDGLLGYQLLIKIREFQLAPQKYPAMTNDYSNFVLGNYGAAYLFIQYLYDRFGSGIIATMLNYSNIITPDTVVGITGGMPMSTIMHDWAAANLLDGKTSDLHYNYSSINMIGTSNGQYYAPLYGISVSSLLSTTRPVSLTNWSAAYYHAPQSMNCTVTPRNGSPAIYGMYFTP